MFDYSQTQENFFSEEPEALEKEIVKTQLKWFNTPKGFGFVNPENNESVDAFLHITTLQEAGVSAIGDGALLLCEIEYGDKGAHVKRVLDVIDPGMVQEQLIKPNGHHHNGIASETVKMKGKVKWYKSDEGFGFIVPEDGRKDVFIHKTCLEKHGLNDLEKGTKVHMTFKSVPKGREVINFDFID